MTEKLQNLVLQAQKCHDKEDWDGAIRYYSEIIDLPKDQISKENRASALNNRGNAFASKGELDTAIRDFDHALKIKPDYAEALSNRGVVSTRKGELDTAIRDFDDVLKLKPDFVRALYNRGVAFTDKGELDTAIRDFDHALKIKPDFLEALNNRGAAFTDKGEFNRAIRDFDDVLKLKPDNAEALCNRGAIFTQKGEFDAAIRDYNHALKIKPDYAEALYNRGFAFVSKGELDAAIRDFDHALKIKPDYAEALSNRGVAFAKKDEFERSISDFDDAIKIKPDLEDAHRNRAISLARIHARKTEAKYKKEYEAQLRQVTDPGAIFSLYDPGEKEYRRQIDILTPKIEKQKDWLFGILCVGFIAIVGGVGYLVFKKEASFTTLFVIAPLTLAWIAVCFPLISHLLGLRKEKRLMQVCAEDYFRKKALARYTLAAEGEHKQRLIAITHAHFATRSAAEFLAGWKPESEENLHPLMDAIEKAIRGAKNAASSKSTE